MGEVWESVWGECEGEGKSMGDEVWESVCGECGEVCWGVGSLRAVWVEVWGSAGGGKKKIRGVWGKLREV